MIETVGFVLAGGLSSRMGRDKSLLELDGEALVQRAARRVAAATGGRAAIVGDPVRHEGFGWPVVADLRAGQGPLGGIEAALASPHAGEWNLIVACDMPFLEVGFLRSLLETARLRLPDCVIALTDRGMEPLCAVYRRRFGEVARRALDAGDRKVRNALNGLEVIHMKIDNAAALANVNTPADWRGATGGEA